MSNDPVEQFGQTLSQPPTRRELAAEDDVVAQMMAAISPPEASPTFVVVKEPERRPGRIRMVSMAAAAAMVTLAAAGVSAALTTPSDWLPEFLPGVEDESPTDDTPEQDFRLDLPVEPSDSELDISEFGDVNELLARCEPGADLNELAQRLHMTVDVGDRSVADVEAALRRACNAYARLDLDGIDLSQIDLSQLDLQLLEQFLLDRQQPDN